MEILISFVVVVVVALFFIINKILSSPFQYPYYKKSFDVSGKRTPKIEEYIEQFICDGGFAEISAHQQVISNWENECEKRIESSILKTLRKKQYERCKDEGKVYCFYFFRTQTRYVQRNHMRMSYKANQVVEVKQYDYEWLVNKYNKLREIGFETTLAKYHSKEQRKLMTRPLRESIMKRDNYTCQICGKYMPDEVGLQIDHIIPVAKGGKSVSSNLQVLCSKCNGHKSDKM